MKTKTKRTLLIVALALGVSWNILCLAGVFPLDKWPLSLAIVFIANLFILVPLMFPSVFRKNETSDQMAELEKKERILAGVTIVLLIAWAITMIACLVYPL